MPLIKATFYKVASRLPNHNGNLGFYTFVNGVSLWLNRKNADRCLVTAGIRSKGEHAPYADVKQFWMLHSHSYVDEQSRSALHMKWEAIPEDQFDPLSVPPPVVQEPVEVAPKVVKTRKVKPKKKRITQKELVAARQSMKMTPAEAAKSLGVPINRYKQWEVVELPNDKAEMLYMRIRKRWTSQQQNAQDNVCTT